MAGKKKGEFEKMGDLEKGVGGKKENTEDVIKEIESFDATKDSPPALAAEGASPEKSGGESKTEPETEDKPSEKIDGSEDMKKELEREREKNKNLAKIIEKVSSVADKPPEKVVAEKPVEADVEPKLKEIEDTSKDIPSLL